MNRALYVYIMGGAGKTIYVGVTNDLLRRVHEHKTGIIKGFTSRYNLNKLLFYVAFNTPGEAIAYEKKVKGWVRRKKDVLIRGMNPTGEDLARDWYLHSAGDSSVAMLLQNDRNFPPQR